MNLFHLKEVSVDEVRLALFSMQSGKSPGPDFFKLFYDCLKEYLLLRIKESQSSGRIFGPLNKTFLCLIPKKKNTEMLEDYLPVSCCNVTYKMITKIFSRRLRPILSKVIGDV